MKIKNWYLWIFATAIIYVLPIMLANVNYVDDMGRAVYGYGWDNDGRIFTNLFTFLLSFGNGVVSVFPFSLILSAIILSISGMIISYVVIGLESKLQRVSSLIFITSPFMLENLAYRFDSLPMSLSVMFAVLPYLVKDKKLFIASSIICLTLTFGLYQTSAMIYLGIALCLMIRDSAKGERCINFQLIGFTVFSFLVAYSIYSYILYFFDITVPRAVLLPLDMSSVTVITQRLSSYLGIYKLLWNDGYMAAILPVLLLASISLASMFISKIHAVNILMIVIYITGLYLLVMLPNLLIVTAWITPRTFVCFPLLIFSLIVIISQCRYHLNDTITTLSVILLISFSFVISSMFGSTLKINDDYAKYIAQNASNDITNNEIKERYKVIISGERPVAKNSANILRGFDIIKFLSPTYMKQHWRWGIYDLGRYYNFDYVENNQSYINNKCDWTVINKRKLYYLLKKEDIYMVDFNYSTCKSF